MDIISNKVYYAVDTIDKLINGICGGSWRNHINILSNPIVKLGKNKISLVFYNNSYVDGGDKYDPNLQDLAKIN